MRKFSPLTNTLLATGLVSPYFLVKLEFRTGHMYHTNLPYDVTINGLGTFQSGNNLMSIEAPRLSTVVDRTVYKLLYADPTFELKHLFEGGVVGTPVTVYLGFINTTGGVVGTTKPGRPFLDYADLLVAYRGVIDTHGYSITEDGVSLSLECSSPMADLDLKRLWTTARESIRSRVETDSCFDQVYEGSSSASFLWGKK